MTRSKNLPDEFHPAFKKQLFTMGKDIKSEASILRQKAEASIKKKPSASDSQLYEAEMLKLIHELKVHQIELEMQNEELMLARSTAQDALEKYTELYDFAPSGYFTLSKEGKIIELNLSGAKLLNKERSRLKNNLFGFFVSNDTRPIFNLFLGKVFGSKNKGTCEVVLSSKGNPPMHVQLSGIASENGEQCIVNAADISERKLAEQALKEINVNKYLKLADYIPGHIAYINVDTLKFEFANSIFEKAFGISRKKIIGSHIREIIGETNYQFALKYIDDVKSGKSVSYENSFDTVSEKRWLQVNYTPVFDDSGHVESIVMLSYDITERKQAEQKLIIANKELTFQNREKEKRAAELIVANKKLAFESEEKGKRADELIIANKELAFQNEEKEKRATELNENKTLLASVLDSSLSGIMAFKSIRNAEGAIMDFEWQLVNAAAGQMVSHSQTEILGKRLLEEMPGNRVEGLFDLYVQVVETGNPLSHEHYYEHEKVKTWFHTVAIKRLDGFVVTFSNITKRKLAEQELIIANKELAHQNEEKEKRAVELIHAKEHAEESDRLKSAFLANISHEIRTPMNGILGFAGLLKESKLKGEEKQQYISIIEKSGVRMLNIINDIMSISNVEAGQMIVNISEMNVNEQIESICTFFRPEAEGKGLQLFFKNNLPLKEAILKTDREKVYAILVNLVKNAIKFTREGSIEFGYEKKGNYFEFFVKDTGIGIRPEQKEFIFERFRQVSESYSRNYEGAGLGLSISKAYVEMLGGRIWVESEEGKGSVFYFTLPYNK